MDPEKASLLSARETTVFGNGRRIVQTVMDGVKHILRIVARTLPIKYVLVSFTTILLFIATYQGNVLQTRPLSSPSSPSSHNDNSSTHIPMPTIQSPTLLQDLWNELHSKFDAHPPYPSNLEKPKHESGTPPSHKEGPYVVDMTEHDAFVSMKSHKQLVASLPAYPRSQFSGRGLVMLAGGKYSEYAATSLGVLREVGSTLPVEVWVKDESEEMPGWCEELEQENMACQRLSDYMDVGALQHPYQWKVFTILFSTFSDVLFLDADSLPVRSPDFIFDSETYLKTGVILWPDYWNNTASSWAPYIAGITDGENDDMQMEKSAESGQLVWNKESHWKSLLLSVYYNYWGPNFFYSLLNNGYAGWGDKDTFPLALRAMREPYHMVDRDVSTAFLTGTIQGIGILQADPTNSTGHPPLFMHANTYKWSITDFFCEESCIDRGTPSHFADPGSPLGRNLREGRRILAEEDLQRQGIDPEPIMWKAFENSACRSVWGNEELCEKAKTFVEKAFGEGSSEYQIS